MVLPNQKGSELPEGMIPAYMMGDVDVSGVLAEVAEGLEAEVTDGVLVVASPLEAEKIFANPGAYFPDLTQTEKDYIQFCTDVSSLDDALYGADHLRAEDITGPAAEICIPGKVFYTGAIGCVEEGREMKLDNGVFEDAGIDYAVKIQSPL